MTTPGERLAQLKKEHGTLDKVLEKTSMYTYIVYDEYGDISYRSTEIPPKDILKNKKTATLKTADCKILDESGKGIGQPRDSRHPCIRVSCGSSQPVY